MNALELIRENPVRRLCRAPAVIQAERAARERRAVEQARAIHRRWLARASARPPDLWHMEADRQAAEARTAEARLRAELAAERRRSETKRLRTGSAPNGTFRVPS
jgi:hypothetical protein